MPRSPWQRLLVADPGLQRTYLAGRVSASVLIALGAATALVRVTEQPSTIAVLAAMLALQTTLAVFGPTGEARLRAAGHAWVVAGAAMSVAVSLSTFVAARYVGFVLAMMGAVWARRFAPGGFGLGMVAFNSYFFAVFIRATPDQLPWLLAADTVGVAAAVVVRRLLLPDRPGRRLRRLLVALRTHCEGLAESPRSTASAAPDRTARAIDEVVLQIHDLLRDRPDVIRDEPRFQRDLFAVVSLSHLLILQAGAPPGAGAAHLPPRADPAERMEAHLAGLEAAAAGRATDARLREAPAHAPGTDDGAAAGSPEGSAVGPAVLQVAVAGTLSILVGSLLSPARWYWAAMTAFFMFVSPGPRGVTLRRAVERTAGTAGGVAAGLLLGYLLAGHSGAELVLVLPLIFAAFWMLKVSYAVMTVMVTVLLALMYDMMGMLTPDLLLLRLGETAIGAGLGAAAAYFVLPSRTRGAVDRVFRDYFDALADVLDALVRAARGRGGSEEEALGAVRRLDRAAGALSAAVYPVVESVPGRRARALRQELVLALTVRYRMHRLLSRILFHPGSVDADDLERRLTTTRRRLASLRDGSSAAGDASATDRADSPEAAALEQLEALLGRLALARADQP